MLAQNFKTATDLGITDKEFNALLKVLGMLEREEIPYAESSPGARPGEGPPTAFNMILVKSRTECGTAACILGWARFITDDENLLRRKIPMELDDLFCMESPHGRRGKHIEDILPADAAIALRNYLTHGEPRWAEALAA